MSKKPLIAISIALPLLAMSASAYAGATISDKRYWPSEAKPSAYVTGGTQSSVFAWGQPATTQVLLPRKVRHHGRAVTPR
jgi:hypothetical protein